VDLVFAFKVGAPPIFRIDGDLVKLKGAPVTPELASQLIYPLLSDENLQKFQFPDARWQRCVVHFYRNAFSVVPKGKVKEVAAMLKAIHTQQDKEEAQNKAKTVAKKLEAMKLTKAAELVRDGHFALMLVAARLRRIAGTRWGTKRYMNMKRLQEQEVELLAAG